MGRVGGGIKSGAIREDSLKAFFQQLDCLWKQWFITHFVSMHADKCSTDNNNDTQHDCVYIWWKVQADESKSYNRLYSESAPIPCVPAACPVTSQQQLFFLTEFYCHQHICQTTTFVVCIFVCIIYSNCLLDTDIFGYSFYQNHTMSEFDK